MSSSRPYRSPASSVCSYVMMMPFKRQALVEFDSVASAERCVSSGTREAVFVAEQQAFFNFSTSQRITRPTNADDPAGGNKVLLLSIQNPLYPITTVSPAEPLHSGIETWAQFQFPSLGPTPPPDSGPSGRSYKGEGFKISSGTPLLTYQ